MIPARLPAALLTLWLAAVVVVVPLPAAGAGADGRLLARLAAFAALALAAAVYRGRPAARRVSLALAALGALAAVGVVQSLAWPAGFARWLSPGHAELAVAARELVSGTGAPTPAAMSLSLAPDLSRSAALAVLAFAAVYFAAFVAGALRAHRRWLAVALVASGLVQVIYGLRAWLGGSAERLRGTFVNPNHLACFLALALAVAFAWVVWSLHRQRHAAGLEQRLALVAPPVLAWFALAAGLLATGSRAGFAAAAAGLLAQCWLLPATIPRRSRGLWPKVLGAAAALAVVLLAARGIRRLGETTLYEMSAGVRPIVWRHCLELWSRFPVLGTGLGTFGESFPLVQPAATTDLYWRRAHSDPLELLVTGGLLGLALAAVALIGLVRPLARALRRGERSEDRAGALAALGALVAVAAHELVDFGLTLPGLALPFAVLLGAPVAVRLRSRSDATRPAPDAAGDGRQARSPSGVPPPG